jgi:acylphosphatase
VTTRARIIVTGRVQGVGFRASCAREANRLGVAGSVRNRVDGTVEVVAEGHEAAVATLTEWCRVGPTFSRVQSIEIVSEAPTGETTFRIAG